MRLLIGFRAHFWLKLVFDVYDSLREELQKITSCTPTVAGVTNPKSRESTPYPCVVTANQHPPGLSDI